MRPRDLRAAIRLCIETGQPLLITGAPGTGKTELAKQEAIEIAREEGGAVQIVHPVCDDPSDYKGLGFPSLDRTYAEFLAYGNLKLMIEAPKLLIIILDDVGQAMPSVQAALMQLVRERSVNGKKISNNVRFVLCTNRKGDKAAVTGLIEPLKSRCTIVALDVHADDWRQWAAGAGMPPELIAFSKLCPDLLHKFVPTSDVTNSPCPRGWGAVGVLQNKGVPAAIEYEIYGGTCGEEFAAKYCAFLKTYREMPNPELWIKDPEKELPENESTLYALTSALAYMANAKNVGQIFKVAMRLDAEFSTFLVFSMVQRQKSLASNAGMGLWAKKFAPYLT